jgi:hypothetical protein
MTGRRAEFGLLEVKPAGDDLVHRSNWLATGAAGLRGLAETNVLMPGDARSAPSRLVIVGVQRGALPPWVWPVVADGINRAYPAQVCFGRRSRR